MICESYESWISSTTSAELSLCVHIYPFMFTCNKDLKQNQECVISQKSLVSVYQKYNSTFSILIAIQFSEDWLNLYDDE